MNTITMNSQVAIFGTPYTGQVVAWSDGRLVVELDGQHDELPTDLCWQSEAGTTMWPCLPEELELRNA